MLYMYGLSKLAHLQFDLSSELGQRTISSLNGYQLTWFYYGYSRAYACILGLTQVAGAALLLFRNDSAGSLAHASRDGEHTAHQHIHFEE